VNLCRGLRLVPLLRSQKGQWICELTKARQTTSGVPCREVRKGRFQAPPHAYLSADNGSSVKLSPLRKELPAGPKDPRFQRERRAHGGSGSFRLKPLGRASRFIGAASTCTSRRHWKCVAQAGILLQRSTEPKVTLSGFCRRYLSERQKRAQQQACTTPARGD
jgi:hypothetical protein